MIFISSKVSDGNMSFLVGDEKEVLKNRKNFFQQLGIKSDSIVEVKQIHGNKVIKVDEPLIKKVEADGMVTNKIGLFLLIKVADCIPIAIYDPKHKAIGLIHVGWRGLEKGIIKNVVKSMQKNFNARLNDLIVQFGPSIGPCHYRMDIWKEAENQLISLGVLKEHIDNPKICTYESKDYFSHRRSVDTNTKEGRFVTILGLKG